jgi:hypothetical protein
MKHIGIFMLITGAHALAACSSSGGGGAAVQCSPTGTCPGNLVCSQGFCVQAGTGGTSGTGGGSGFGGSSGGGFGGSTTDDPVAPGLRPPAPNGGNPGTGTDSVVSVNQLFLGDTDRFGNSDPMAWQLYGYNIDGILSTKTGTNHCKPQLGTPKSKIQTDGPDGLDNSYGANLMPIMATLDAAPSQNTTESIQSGDFTLLFRFANLDSNPSQSSVFAAFYEGAPLGAFPSFDGSDAWDVRPELLTNPSDINSSLFQFPASYVSNGTWVSGDGSGNFEISLGNTSFFPAFRLTHAIITMKIDAQGNVTDGIIAGVLPTEALVNEFKKVAGGFDPGLCDGPTFESIAQQIRGASDIMQDGTNGDPTTECDGISVGLGFSGTRALLGGIAPFEEIPPDPCTNP